MTSEELQTYIDTHIPIVKTNGFSIVEATPDKVVVGARIADHVNHRDSAFGGSLSTVLILAAWARVRVWTDAFDPGAVIVISEQNVQFTHPVLADFEAHSTPLSPDVLSKAQRQLARFGKTRFTVDAEIMHEGETMVRAKFTGVFVVSARKTAMN